MNREAAEDFGTAYEVVMEAYMARMQEELDKAELGTVSPMIAKLVVAETELGAYVDDKEALESSFYELAGSFHERRNAENSRVAEKSRPSRSLIPRKLNWLMQSGRRWLP